MPRLQVHGERTRALVAALVYIARRVVVDTKHGHKSVGESVRAGNVRVTRTDIVHVQADTACGLGDHGTGLERVVDSLNRVVRHGEQEAAGELRARRARVEEGGRGVGEELLRHEVVRFDRRVNVFVRRRRGEREHVSAS